MILEETEEGEGSIVVDVWFLFFYSILRLLTSPSFLVIAMNLLIV